MEKSFNEMYQEIVKKAESELDDIMNVSLIDKMKDTAKKVMGRSVRTKDPLFWPSGMLMLGLLSAAKDRVIRPEIMAHISAHTDMWLRDYDGKIDFVDDALAGYCFVKSYEYTQEDKYKEAADKIADFIAKTPRDNDGSVIYNPGRDSTNIFADGAGQVSMFMAAYGEAFGDSDISISAGARLSAAKQIKNFYNHGIDKRTGLNYHGYSMEEGTKKGLLGWGRAFGWLFMGITEAAVVQAKASVQGAPTKAEAIAEDIDVVEIYRNICEIALDYQRFDGGWSWQMQAVEGHIDMSATGMIAYCIARGVNAGIFADSAVPPLKEKLAKARDCMIAHTKDGDVLDALSSCDDFGVHYQTYGAYPWGQGAVLAALAEIGE